MPGTFDPSGADLNGATYVDSISSSPPEVTPTPAVPAANVAVQNNTGYDVMVYLTGFTAANARVGASQATVAAMITGVGAGGIYLPDGYWISLGPFTAAGTWNWQAI